MQRLWPFVRGRGILFFLVQDLAHLFISYHFNNRCILDEKVVYVIAITETEFTEFILCTRIIFFLTSLSIFRLIFIIPDMMLNRMATNDIFTALRCSRSPWLTLSEFMILQYIFHSLIYVCSLWKQFIWVPLVKMSLLTTPLYPIHQCILDLFQV